MNSWLISFQTDRAGRDADVHLLLPGEAFTLAEAACDRMGATWWPDGGPPDTQGCYWRWPQGTVWLNRITLLSEREAADLNGLNFLEAWTVEGTRHAPVIRDAGGTAWEDAYRA
ncbi:hypothetical protein PMPD1_4444 (plasmid) [Paramixta manurensis]|uniref:Uncharacterized protein n=1 Tax=Paramixta manurensis TaxID=2740817 RepID=A0A6M8UR38_9GAMM|nr:hypothetical protein PMPD1_4444 [Erwiniaceae bacterium PD-1]